jgi:hypothetical protein
MPGILLSRPQIAVLVLGVFVVSCSSSRRQKVSVNPKPPEVARASPTIPKPLPFKPGEVLLYEVEFSKLILSGTIGQIKLYVLPGQSDPKASDDEARGNLAGPEIRAASVVGTAGVPDGAVKYAAAGNPTSFRLAAPSDIEFKAEASSKGFFTWLFGVKVNHVYDTLVNSEDLGLRSSVRTLEEGNARREQRAVMDLDKGVVTVTETDLVNKSAAPKVKTGASPRWVQDVLSAIYYLRSQPLKDGQVRVIPISDQAQLYSIEVVAGKPEEVSVGAGKYSATPVDVRMFDGRFVKRSGQLTVWLTDDPARLPVKAKLKISGVTVTIGLTAVKG